MPFTENSIKFEEDNVKPSALSTFKFPEISDVFDDKYSELSVLSNDLLKEEVRRCNRARSIKDKTIKINQIAFNLQQAYNTIFDDNSLHKIRNRCYQINDLQI